jgi:hypothetical protein
VAEPTATESVAATAVPDASEQHAAGGTLARQALGGAIATAIALACVLPPLVHIVTGPLGPFIGAFVVAQRLEPDPRGCAVIAATLGLSFGLLGAAAAALVAGLSGPSGPPDWFPDTATVALIVGGMAAYAAALGGAGAAVGARWNS